MSINQFFVLCTEAVITFSASGLLILGLILLIECTAALFPVRDFASGDDWQDKKVTVLVPAHNEELIIRSTLLGISPALKTQDRLVVIADNCNDKTAEIARAAGATVIERFDTDNRGKGYALDYGLRFLESDPPDVVVFVDADCQVHERAIEQLTEWAIAFSAPVQATYLMAKSSNSSPKELVSAFAFKVKNLVRPRGLAQLGLPCLLTGTGMAFPWSVIRAVDLASGDIVEDMKLSLDLTIAGHRPVFCPFALVTGQLPLAEIAAKSQRTRWEHGHLKTLLTYVPQMLLASVNQKRLDLLIGALDLCVPPLSLLVIIWLVLITVSLLFGVLAAFWIPASVLAITGLFILIAIVTAWAKFASEDLKVQELLVIPFYIFWKIPLYLKFLVKPQTMWIRTKRY